MTQIQFNENDAKMIKAGVQFGEIKTRDGKPVRILAWDAKGAKPICGLIDEGSIERPMLWTNDGKADARPNVTMNLDLVLEVEGGEV